MRFLLPFALAGCAALQIPLLDDQDNQTLAAAANAYWLAVRWNDPAGAAKWVASADQKLRLGHLMSDSRFKVTDAELVQVVLGDALPRERRPDTREGVALVRLESMDLTLNRVEVQTLEQHWLKGSQGWHIDEAQSPVGADRPW